MQDAVRWLDAHSGAASFFAACAGVLVTVGLLAATCYYVRLTREMVRELRLQRLGALAPVLRVDWGVAGTSRGKAKWSGMLSNSDGGVAYEVAVGLWDIKNRRQHDLKYVPALAAGESASFGITLPVGTEADLGIKCKDSMGRTFVGDCHLADPEERLSFVLRERVEMRS